MTHVFISYKHDDHDFVENLRQRLRSVGLMTWADTDIQAGEEWKPAIDDAIRDSFAVIVVMTPDARASEFVTYEWSYAMGLKRPRVHVVPIMLKPTELHPKLKDLQYLDFTRPSTRPWDALQKRLIEIKAQPVHATSNILQPAPKHITPKLSKNQGLIKQLDSPKPEARAAAAKVLGDERVSEAMEKLIELLQDEAENVRVNAAKALGKIGRDHARPALCALADQTDSSRDTQLAAINALAQIHSRRAVEFLYSKYKENKDDREVVKALVKAVGAHNIQRVSSVMRAGLKELGQTEFDNFETDLDRLSEFLSEAEADQQRFSGQQAEKFMERIENEQERCALLIAYFESFMDIEKVKDLREYDFIWMKKVVKSLSED